MRAAADSSRAALTRGRPLANGRGQDRRAPRLRSAALACCIASALAACAPADPGSAPATPAPPAVSTAAPATASPAADGDGGQEPAAQLAAVGRLRVGAAFGKAPGDEAFKAAGMREAMEGDCEYYDQGTLPDGLSMMVIADRIARFDVRGDGDPGERLDARPAGAPAVPFGLWVGMDVAAAKQRLPAGVVVSPHAYVSPDGDYLTWTDGQAGLALRLETLNGVVTSIYWGQPDAVELIEGCA
ncbi:hypothetical protein [Stenotrophomonas mori]|uniref:Lectin n=1 Tax=Stenotrophomonas mori TaxID=2871096 RepID=A0ABT0SFT7_9GAMM|nr:hypothetical protein [Stenotrophomonas mori]MCL7714127.1 hypothetical protein [Stenotrophomonas mori]